MSNWNSLTLTSDPNSILRIPKKSAFVEDSQPNFLLKTTHLSALNDMFSGDKDYVYYPKTHELCRFSKDLPFFRLICSVSSIYIFQDLM